MIVDIQLYIPVQILVNLKNFRFCDQISQKNMNDKHFGKVNVTFVISI